MLPQEIQSHILFFLKTCEIESDEDFKKRLWEEKKQLVLPEYCDTFQDKRCPRKQISGSYASNQKTMVFVKKDVEDQKKVLKIYVTQDHPPVYSQG